MRGSLKGVRSRVERLATLTASAACAGNHQRIRIIWLEGHEPAPPWPEAEAGGQCACGGRAGVFNDRERRSRQKPSVSET